MGDAFDGGNTYAHHLSVNVGLMEYGHQIPGTGLLTSPYPGLVISSFYGVRMYSWFSRSFTARGSLVGIPLGYKAN